MFRQSALCSHVFSLQNDQQLDCALDLMRRLPPQQIEKNLSDLIDLVSARELQTGLLWELQTGLRWELVSLRSIPDSSQMYLFCDSVSSPPLPGLALSCLLFPWLRSTVALSAH